MASRTKSLARQGIHASPKSVASSPSSSLSSSYRDSSGVFDTQSSSEDEENSQGSLGHASSLNVTTELDVEGNRSPILVRRTRQSPRHPEGGSWSSPGVDKSTLSSPEGSTGSKRRSPRLAEKEADKHSGGNIPTKRLYPTLPREDQFSHGINPGFSPPPPIRRRYTRHSANTDKNPNFDAQTGLLICAVCLLILAIFLLLLRKTPENEVPQPTQALDKSMIEESFQNEFKALRDKFPAQDRRFWSTLSAASKRIIREDEPKQPAVILIAATSTAIREAECLAHHYLTTVTGAYRSKPAKELNITRQFQMEPNEAKLRLDEALMSNFDVGSKGVALYGLEDLAPTTAMLLHGYCDNENARYKEAFIVFTLDLGDIGAVPSGSYGDSVIEKHLRSLWYPDLDEDNIAALLSRLANNIVVAKTENPDTTKTFCQFR